MSYYYKYSFVSPEPVYALVKEELKSYFDTGAIDDLLFPLYTSKCLDRLGRGSYKINQAVLHIDDFQSRLPDDFYAVREAWLCTNITSEFQLAGSQYQQVMGSTTTRIDTPDVYCDKCNECSMPDIIKAVYKTTFQAFAYFKKQYLLKPGNIWSKGECSEDCANFHSHGPESFDLHDNKFTVTFRQGEVYLLYYSKTYDCHGYELVPDNLRIKEYIEFYLKARVYEQLVNQVTDEGVIKFLMSQAQSYQAKSDEAYIIAQIETKKDDIYGSYRRIERQQRRFQKYNIS